VPKKLTVAEGETAGFAVRLGADPGQEVEVEVLVGTGDRDIAITSPGILRFDSSNYDQPQAVALAAAQDSDCYDGVTILVVRATGFWGVQVRATESDNDLILYVDSNTPNPGGGADWGNAFRYLQEALYAARDIPGVREIRVAQGTYRPDHGNVVTYGDRKESFRLVNGMVLKGGYAGNTGANPDERDMDRYPTVLSGDLNGDDGPDFAHNEENSFRVVSGQNVNSSTILDGFVITGGNASNAMETEYSSGAGLHLYQSDVTVIDCTFQANFAGNNDGGGAGAGVLSLYGTPKFTHCRFIDNRAVALDGGEGSGGALMTAGGACTVTDCSFVGNVSGHDGGAVFIMEADATLTGSVFADNLARLGGSGSHGGAVYIYDGNLTIDHCTFVGNTARSEWAEPWTDYGGAIYVGNFADLVLSNSILWANSARYGSQIATDWIYSSVAVSYCDIQGGYEGTGSLDTDPLFASAENGDYHLKSQAGRWDPVAGVWVKDDVTSPCIDAGDPAALVGLEPFPNGGMVNMGAYGGTAQASKSWFGGSVCEAITAGDINGDCRVNLVDLGIMARHWLEDHNQ